MKRILILLFLLAFSSLVFAQEAVRTWKSKSGKTIKAAWDSEKDSEPETVSLLMDGKRYKVPLKNLSEKDQKYVTDVRARKAQRGRGGKNHGQKEVTVGGFRLPTAKKYAVLIGVTDYVTMNDLKYTVQDVEAIRDQLLKIGFQKENVQMLTTGSDAANQPTQRNIQRAVKSALDQAKLGDLVFFAFSGHGAQVGDEVFFCPQDTVDEDISSTAVSITNVMADLSKSKAGFKWLVIDACRNNPFRQRVTGVKSIQRIDDPPRGIALFQSCAQDEYSYEDDSVKHGLFTSNFVKGMQGAADSNNDGVLTFLEVCTYTTSQTVREVQQKFRANQRPYLSGNISDFVLMEDLNRPKADDLFAEAQKLFTEEDYETAKTKIAEAMEMYPKEQKYAHLGGTIDRFLKIQQENERLAREKAEAERKAKEAAEAERKAKETAEAKRKAMEVEELANRQRQTVFTPIPLVDEPDSELPIPLVDEPDSELPIPLVEEPDSELLEGAITWKSYIEHMKPAMQTFKPAAAEYKNIINNFNPGSRKAQDAEAALRKAAATPYSYSSAFLQQEKSKLESLSEEGYRTDAAPYKTVETNVTKLEEFCNLIAPEAKSEDLLKAMEILITVIPGDIALPPEFYPNLNQYDKLWEQKGYSIATSVTISHDGKYMAIPNGKDINILAFRTGEVLQTLKGHTSEVRSMSYSSDDRFIASGSKDETVRIWNVQTGECMKTLQGHASGVYSVSYSPDSRFIVSGGWDRIVRIWNAQTGECMKTLKGHGYDINSVSYSPDGRYIASGSDDKIIQIWNAQTGECVKTLKGHTCQIHSVSYSPDGRFIASGSGGYDGDNTVRIWNARTGECVKTFKWHTNYVKSVSYSPDGQFLASGSNDKTVRIWDMQTGECVKTLEGHAGYVDSVNYSPDGKYLSAGAINSLTVWRVAK